MPNPEYQLNRGELARLQRLFTTNPQTQCWEWQGPKTPNGYAKWQRGPGHRDRVAHRVVYEHYKRQLIPEGMQLDHLCRTRHCINPDHMEIVTGSETPCVKTTQADAKPNVHKATPTTTQTPA